MDVAVIGAAGGVGRQLVTALSGRGDSVTGIHRNPAQQQSVTAAGGRPVLGDLVEDSVDELAAMIAGHDAVVFAAGAYSSGPEQTALVDGKGVDKASAAAMLAGVDRFVLVSVFADSARDAGLGKEFEQYIRVKREAESRLTRTNLDWVIVRPGNLRDDGPTGTVDAGLALREQPVQRADIAEFIAETLHYPALSRTIVEVTQGQTPITEAVTMVAASVGPRC